MRQSEWTQKALAVLEREGLVQTGFVNIKADGDGYALQIADQDNDVFCLTVHTRGAAS